MIPLLVRSHYSMMQGTGSVERLCRRAAVLGYQKLALTDRDNLYGMWRFVSACQAEGIEPVIGAELTDPVSESIAVCLVKNSAGYRNLCRIITRRHTFQGFCLKTDLPLYADGLVVLTSNPGFLLHWHEREMDTAACMPVRPVSRHTPLLRTAKQLHVPVVAVPDSFMIDPDEIRIHRLLRAIADNTTVSRLAPAKIADPRAYLAPPEEYERRFAACPDAVKNTGKTAERLTFKKPAFGTVMPPRDKALADQPFRVLAEKVWAGARDRYGSKLPGKVISRIEHELAIIREKGFCEYFLVVKDIVDKSSRTCGRGSGAASIVSYCLKITNVCPVKYNLFFERFLNPGRSDPPDIDIDFAWDERDHILDWVLDTYKGHAAMVAGHIFFQPRMAVRETAKVFGLPPAEISKITRQLSRLWNPEAFDTVTAGTSADTYCDKASSALQSIPARSPWHDILAYAARLTGIPRYLSVHPGGVVITPDPIDHYVPVQTAPKGVPLIQWEKDGAEDAGLVKIDLLGNRSLGVIRDAVAEINTSETAFKDFSTQDPEDDPDTRQTVAFGNTMGCFYIESPAMRLLQKKSRMGDFEHVVIHSSIIRPAANEFIREYIRRLHGGEYKPVHPLMDYVLNDTFGLMVFQEDVSRVAVSFAGFSRADADGLRKILSKKSKKRKLGDYYERFARGAAARGAGKAVIEKVWNMIISFSGYSFCKPHSASYARVSFQAAFLKTHYPAAFMAAVISNQGGFYSTFAYVSEARRLGLVVRHPDVNQSGIRWSGRNHELRVGLSAIRDLSVSLMNHIIHERDKKPFACLEDFFERTRPPEDATRSLIHSGALNSLTEDANRAVILWRYAAWRKNKPFGRTPALPEERRMDRFRKEFSAMGFLCTCHPMSLFSDILKDRQIVKAKELPAYRDRRIMTAGWLITGKPVKTKHGDPMEFLTFEDETGTIETVFFPGVYKRFSHLAQ
ncbi:MAG: DNA polymerase III subunit alpha, partial [Thermodesulfobacteriota bacterium]